MNLIKKTNIPLLAITLAGFLSLFLAIPLSASSDKTLTAENPVIAEIEGKPLRLQSIEDKKINDLRKQLHRLIQASMKKEVVIALSKKYPKYQIGNRTSVSKEEIKAFYDINNLVSQGTLKELSLEINYYLRHLKEQSIVSQLFQEAVNNKLVKVNLTTPNDFLIKVPIETAFFRNNAKSDVMLLEFSDYQCPACRMVQPTISELKTKYNKKVIFAYRHMPLSFHTEADEAALAVECARDQGKFEALHQLLFRNQRQLAIEKSRIYDYLKQLGESINITSTKKYITCIDNRKYNDRVQNDMQTAVAVGVTGTPAFIIGRYDKDKKVLTGEMISGGLKMSGFEAIFNKYLTR